MGKCSFTPEEAELVFGEPPSQASGAERRERSRLERRMYMCLSKFAHAYVHSRRVGGKIAAEKLFFESDEVVQTAFEKLTEYIRGDGKGRGLEASFLRDRVKFAYLDLARRGKRRNLSTESWGELTEPHAAQADAGQTTAQLRQALEWIGQQKETHGLQPTDLRISIDIYLEVLAGASWADALRDRQTTRKLVHKDLERFGFRIAFRELMDKHRLRASSTDPSLVDVLTKGDSVRYGGESLVKTVKSIDGDFHAHVEALTEQLEVCLASWADMNPFIPFRKYIDLHYLVAANRVRDLQVVAWAQAILLGKYLTARQWRALEVLRRGRADEASRKNSGYREQLEAWRRGEGSLTVFDPRAYRTAVQALQARRPQGEDGFSRTARAYVDLVEKVETRLAAPSQHFEETT